MIRAQYPTALIEEVIQDGNKWMALEFPVVDPENSGISLVYQETFSHEPSQEELDGLKARCLSTVRQQLISLINKYDESEHVNSFLLNGHNAWLDKSTRVGLVNSVNTRIKNGDETITLWLGKNSFTIPCEKALELLETLELYAMDCFNKTAEHKATVMRETDIYNLFEYNYRTGYPEKVTINI